MLLLLFAFIANELLSKLCVKPLTGAPEQQWTWGSVRTGTGRGYYNCIVNRASGLAIDIYKKTVPEDKAFASLVMWTPDGYETQNWLISPDGHIYVHHKNEDDEDKVKYEYVIDLDGKGGIDGAYCGVYRLHSKDNPQYYNQLWKVVPVAFKPESK